MSSGSVFVSVRPNYVAKPLRFLLILASSRIEAAETEEERTSELDGKMSEGAYSPFALFPTSDFCRRRSCAVFVNMSRTTNAKRVRNRILSFCTTSIETANHPSAIPRPQAERTTKSTGYAAAAYGLKGGGGADEAPESAARAWEAGAEMGSVEEMVGTAAGVSLRASKEDSQTKVRRGKKEGRKEEAAKTHHWMLNFVTLGLSANTFLCIASTCSSGLGAFRPFSSAPSSRLASCWRFNSGSEYSVLT